VRAHRIHRLQRRRRRRLDQRARALGVGGHGPQYLLHADRRMLGVPAVVIGHHGDARVAELRFARQLGLGHVAHADDIAVPGSIEPGLRQARELRTFHGEIRTAAHVGDARAARGALDGVTQPRADGLGHRYMGDQTGTEEALVTGEGSIDELIDDHKRAGRQLLLQRADRAYRDDLRDTGALEGIDVGAIVDFGGR
jgi:hypothetical protein